MHSSPRRTPKKHSPVFRFCLLALSILFGLALLSPTAFAKTYIITDGERLVTYTDAQTGNGALPEGSQGAIRLRLSYRGTSRDICAQKETVAQLLTRLGCEIADTDQLSHSPDTPVFEGMELRVDSIVVRQEIYPTAIPHPVTYCSDATLPEGTEEVLVKGKDGQLVCTADVTYVNGTETHRKVLTETQTIAPVTEIIAQGTAKAEFEPETGAMPVIGEDYIVMPSGEILSYYKTDNVTATGYTHTDAGCDMTTSTGTTVRYGTAAVDPRFIPYGTKMLIVSHDGERYYGIATAEDCGGAIKRDKMDLYFPTYDECIEFGKRRCTIYFLE